MIQFLIAIMLISSSGCEHGVLSQYSRSATERVIANRSVPHRTAYTLPDNWIEYDVLVAVDSCSRLGETGVVMWREHRGRYIVFDCSGHASTSAWMRRNRIIGEVDYNTARAWGSIGRGDEGRGDVQRKLTLDKVWYNVFTPLTIEANGWRHSVNTNKNTLTTLTTRTA